MLLGIDPSLTSTGIATEHGETWRLRTAPNSSRDYDTEKRLLYIEEGIEKALFTFGTGLMDRAIIEGLSFGSRGTSKDILSYIQWMIKCKCAKYKFGYLIVPPKTLKKFATGNASAEKWQMKSALETKLGKKVDMNNDEVDAFWLMLYGKEH